MSQYQVDLPETGPPEDRNRDLEREVTRRTRSEQHLFELLAVTGDLAAARTRDEAAQLVLDRGMAAAGAVMAALWELSPDGTELLLVASSGSPERSAAYQRVPLDQDSPLAHAVRTGEPVFLGSMAEYAVRFPASAARADALRDPSHVAFALLPLAGADRPVGGALFAYDRERELDASDRAFMSILVRQCALAFENIALHEEERAQREAALRTRGESELLYQLTAGANRLENVDDICQLALETVERGSACDRSAILLFDEDGVMRFRAWRGLSDTYRAAVEGHSPWVLDHDGPETITVTDTELDPAWAPYRDVFRAEGIRALAFVPLVERHRLIGKFMLYRAEPRPFTPHELQLSAAVASQVAIAFERRQHHRALARSLEDERHARLTADEATRAREEILSVVSHDLRTPLGTIMMSATNMMNIDTTDRDRRLRATGERIHRQAASMARMIGDLVDFAGIQAGRLAIEPASHTPIEIITAARELFTPIADERGLRLEVRVHPGLPAIRCDSDRAVQVFSNLVTNAIKVTPRGGLISIGAERRDDEIVFFVRDTGPGIDAHELPKLFERFWRSPGTRYRGAGLGLSIARGIVDAHGGRIWAESQLGQGSTFYFTLAKGHRN